MAINKLKKWLYMALSVKWWLLLIIVGLFAFLVGMWTLISTETSRQTVIDFVNFCELIFPEFSFEEGMLIFVIGIILAILGIYFVTKNYISIAYPNGKRSYYNTKMLHKGAKIVTIGGGSGLNMLLSGLKEYTCNITACVTVGDDGGSSGRLREEYGVIPLGDIRNCIVALADKEELMEKLFNYRFNKGNELGGHSLGNLLLLAMNDIEGDFDDAMSNVNKLFHIRGKVLPIAKQPIVLKASLNDGSVVCGETNVREANGKIEHLQIEPSDVSVNEEVLKAIDEADAIILGPGSLYTSIIPNLLVNGVAKKIKNSKAKVYYVCNIATEKGETDDYTAQEHLKAIVEHSLYGIVDYVVVNNNFNLSKEVKVSYAKMGVNLVNFDGEKLHKMGAKIIAEDLLMNDSSLHHNADKLAQILVENIYRDYRYKSGKIKNVFKIDE